MDLLEDIKKLDKMIYTHGRNEDDVIMLSQYQARKAKLIGFFIKELNVPSEISFDSLIVIKKFLNRFINENDKIKSNLESNQIENLNKLADAI